MSDGKWVVVPGKGRRWQQPSGELMRQQPGLGFVREQLIGAQTAARNALLGIGDPLYRGFGNVADALLGAKPSAAPTDAQLKAQGYGFGVHEYDPLERRAPTDAELRAQGYGFGVHEYDPLDRGKKAAPPAPTLPPASGTPTPIVHGLGADGRVDRTQSDLYKQYALNPQGQFGRYFQSPEMNQYFGQISGAPKDAAAMTALASQGAAPTTSPLSTYYRAQSAAGRGNMEEVVGGLTYGKNALEAANIKKWAEANPMLAFREYNKRFPQGQPGIGPTPATLQTDADYGTFGEMFKKEKRFFPGAEPPTVGAASTTQPSTPYTMPTPGGGFDTSQAYVNPAAKTFLQNKVLDVDAMKKLQQAAYTNPMNTTSQYANPLF